MISCCTASASRVCGSNPVIPVQIPPLGKEITVEGMVRRPAIYELNGETKLAEILEIAGGVLTSGTLRHIEVERVVAHESRTMLRLDIPEGNGARETDRALAEFDIQDGDRIRISPILPYSEKTIKGESARTVCCWIKTRMGSTISIRVCRMARGSRSQPWLQT